MNFIDIFIAIILLWFGYKGFKKGLVFELVSIVALILGVYGGLKFSDSTAEYLTTYVDSEYLSIASFTVTFLGILLLVFAAGKVVEKIIKLVALGMVNKLLGVLFGFLKAAIALGVLVTIIESYDQKLNFLPSEVKETSKLYSPLLDFSSKVMPEIEKNNLFQEFTSSSVTEIE